MTSLRCFSIKGLRTWFAGADGLFCITPFYSTSRVLSVQGSMFDVQGSMFELGPPTHSLTHPPARSRIGKLGCGFAALCSLRLIRKTLAFPNGNCPLQTSKQPKMALFGFDRARFGIVISR